MSAHNQSLMFMLIFTIITSFFAYVIVVRAYDTYLSPDFYSSGQEF